MQMPDLQQPALPLRDIKLPAEPGYWPLAPGWWILAAVAALLLIWIGIKAHQRRQRKKHWLAIEQQLSVLEFDFQTQQNKQQLLQQLSAFLRRFVRHQLRDEQALSCQGEDWIAYLNQWLPGQPFTPFSEALTTGMYQPACDYDEAALLQLTRQLIKTQVMRATPQPVAGGRHV
jgi:hypothetical protein